MLSLHGRVSIYTDSHAMTTTPLIGEEADNLENCLCPASEFWRCRDEDCPNSGANRDDPYEKEEDDVPC